MSVVDTNILVYATSLGSEERERARRALERLQSEGAVSTTRQIVREYLATMTRPQAGRAPLKLAQATAEVERFLEEFDMLEDGLQTSRELPALTKRVQFGGKQVHDADIVATLLAHGETRLLTFNGTDLRRLTPLIEIVEL